MDPAGFCTQTRVFIVAGKGGVGKTTVSAALARMASLAGLTTLVVEVEGKSGLATAFGQADALSYQEVVLAGGAGEEGAEVRARTLTPDDALLEYLENRGLGRVSRRLVSSGAIDVVATAAPGIKDILVLGKVKQLERAGADTLSSRRGPNPTSSPRPGAPFPAGADALSSRRGPNPASSPRPGAPSPAGADALSSSADHGRPPPDLIVLDAPAAGHAVRFLTSAHGLLDAVRAGPIRAQAQDVIELLVDPERCQVLLVTLPEETPVNEVVETAYALEDRVGVSLTAVVVNALYPAIEGLDADPVQAAEAAGANLVPGEAGQLASAAAFRRRRSALHAAQVARLAEALPLAQIHLPFLFTTEAGRAEIDTLAQAFADQVRGLPTDVATARR